MVGDGVIFNASAGTLFITIWIAMPARVSSEPDVSTVSDARPKAVNLSSYISLSCRHGGRTKAQSHVGPRTLVPNCYGQAEVARLITRDLTDHRAHVG